MLLVIDLIVVLVMNAPIVDILLKATGDAPILKKRKWQVEGEKDVGFVINFVKQFLKLEKHENLVIFTPKFNSYHLIQSF